MGGVVRTAQNWLGGKDPARPVFAKPNSSLEPSRVDLPGLEDQGADAPSGGLGTHGSGVLDGEFRHSVRPRRHCRAADGDRRRGLDANEFLLLRFRGGLLQVNPYILDDCTQ